MTSLRVQTAPRTFDRWNAAWLFVVLLACSTYFFPRWADWNQNSRFDLVLAVVHDHTLAIDTYVANTGDYAFVNGHYYSDKAPGMALLGVPVYAAFYAMTPTVLEAGAQSSRVNSALTATLRQPGSGLEPQKLAFFTGLSVTTFLVVAVPSAVLSMLVFHLAGQFGCTERQQRVATVLYSLATSAFSYANAFVGHQTAAFLLFAALVVLFAVRRKTLGRVWITAAGFCLAYAAITEYPVALAGGIVGLYAVFTLGQWREVLARLAVGSVPPIALLGAYDYAAFGTVLPVGYAHSTLWTGVHQIGFMSLTYPHPDALWGITFSPYRGLFFLSPFLLFAIPGYRLLWSDSARRSEFWVILLTPLAFLLVNGSSAMWAGGFAVGPRYIVAGLPFLALAAALGLAQAWCRPLWRPAVLVAVAWSFIAVWAESIGGQSFPDYTPNPLFDRSLPSLASGDIARNLGMLLGLSGWASLLPLFVILALALPLTMVGWRRDLMRGHDPLASARSPREWVGP